MGSLFVSSHQNFLVGILLSKLSRIMKQSQLNIRVLLITDLERAVRLIQQRIFTDNWIINK